MFSARRHSAQAKKKVAAQGFEWQQWSGRLLLLFVVLTVGVYLNRQDTLLPIKMIQLSSTFDQLDEEKIETILRPLISQGFFSLDIHALQKMLRKEAWVAAVSMRRVWPDRLNIKLVEHKPVARWDDRHLISDQAVVFTANAGKFQQLPLIHTEHNNVKQLMTQFYQLRERFKTLDETVLSVRQDRRGALDIGLSDGLMIKVGRKQATHKIARLIAVYQQQIQPRRADIQQLDLRYSNGFAVGWKKEVLQTKDQASIWSHS